MCLPLYVRTVVCVFADVSSLDMSPAAMGSAAGIGGRPPIDAGFGLGIDIDRAHPLDQVLEAGR